MKVTSSSEFRERRGGKGEKKEEGDQLGPAVSSRTGGKNITFDIKEMFTIEKNVTYR